MVPVVVASDVGRVNPRLEGKLEAPLMDFSVDRELSLVWWPSDAVLEAER